MKYTGMTRQLDPLGRIVIPIELRNMRGITPGTPIDIYTEDEYIVLRKRHEKCIFCSSEENLIDYKEKKVCKSCISGL